MLNKMAIMFIAVSMLIEAKKSISSIQLARHLKLAVNTTYELVQKIRKGLLGNVSSFLQSKVEKELAKKLNKHIAFAFVAIF